MENRELEIIRIVSHWQNDGNVLPNSNQRRSGDILCYNWHWTSKGKLIRSADDLVDGTLENWNYDAIDERYVWMRNIRSGNLRRFFTCGEIVYNELNTIANDGVIRDDAWVVRRRHLEGVSGDGIRSFV